MKKEEWLKIRNNDDISMDVWWEFYKEKGGMLTNFNEFVQIFSQIQISTVVLNGKITNLQTALKKIREHYDDKFSVVKIHEED